MTRKRINAIIFLVTFVILFSAVPNLSVAEAAAPSISFVKVNGEKVAFPDGQPFIESGRTLVPVRFVAEALGFEVDWIQATQTVTINNGQILLQIGSKTATANGKSVSLDVPAKLIKTDGKDRTYVPLRFVSESLNCTVDWFNANRSIVINSLLSDGKEESLYIRCKQSELFYEYTPINSNAEWDSLLYLKSSLAEFTVDACLEADWFIARYYTRYPNNPTREYGSDIYININKPTLQARHEVKALLQTFYPTSHEKVYDILMKVAREEIFENNGMIPTTICGTYGTHYYDNREVEINKLFSTDHIAIQVKDSGYVNPNKPYIWSKEQLESSFLPYSVSRHESGKWYMETYQLDKW